MGTCLVLGGKLSEVRNRQLLCYSSSRDLETDINNTIMKLSFDQNDFSQLNLHNVRSNTPCKELSPTPLDKHRSREPSPFRMPPLKLSSGTNTPGKNVGSQDPHAYFSRPNSSQSIYGGRGGTGKPLDLDTFRAAMEAKQMEDDSPPQRRPNQLSKSTSGNIVLRSASGVVLCRSDGTEAGTSGAVFDNERPGSAMSDTSIDIPDLASHHSRPPSRLGDQVSGAFDHFSEAPVNYSDKYVQEELQRKMVLQEDKDKFYREKREAAEAKEKEAALAELQQLEDMKNLKEKKLLEERQAAEEKKREEELKKKQTEERLKAQKLQEEKELLEAKRNEEEKQKKLEEKKKEEESLKLEAKKKEEEKQKLEAKKKEEEMQKLEAKKKEEEKQKLEAKKKAEEKQKLEAKKKEEEKQRVEAKKKEEEKLKLEANKKEEEKKRVEAKKKEDEKQKLEANKKEEERQKLEAKKKEEEKQRKKKKKRFFQKKKKKKKKK